MYSTDLPAIQNILLKNIQENKELIDQNNGKVTNFALNWQMSSFDLKELLEKFVYQKKIDYVICSDVIFNETHVTDLVSCISN